MKFGKEYTARPWILKTVKELAHDSKGARDNAACNAGVYGVCKNFHLELEADNAAQAAC